jgi:hypothetical protein
MTKRVIELEENDWNLVIFFMQIAGNAVNPLITNIAGQLKLLQAPPQKADGADEVKPPVN